MTARRPGKRQDAQRQHGAHFAPQSGARRRPSAGRAASSISSPLQWLPDDFPWVAARDATFWAVLSVPNATHAGMTVYCAKAGEGGSYEPGAIVDEFFFENRARRARRNARGAYARRRRVMVGGRLKERGVCGMRFSIGYCLI